MCISTLRNPPSSGAMASVDPSLLKPSVVKAGKSTGSSSVTDSKRKHPHIIVQHNYHDHSQDEAPVGESNDDTVASMAVAVGAGGDPASQHHLSFPLKLYEMLERVETDGNAHIVSWQPHGRCFVVHKPELFKELLPHYFKLSKIASFQRQLNLYGFMRLTRGMDKGGYYHEMFLRGKIFLVNRIQRVKVKGTGVRARSNPDQEPDFWAMLPWVSNNDSSTSATTTQQQQQQPLPSQPDAKPDSSKKAAAAPSPVKESAPKASHVPSASLSVVSHEDHAESASPMHASVASAEEVHRYSSHQITPNSNSSSMIKNSMHCNTFDSSHHYCTAPATTTTTSSSVQQQYQSLHTMQPPAQQQASMGLLLDMEPLPANTSNLATVDDFFPEDSQHVDDQELEDEDSDVVLKGWGKPFHYLDPFQPAASTSSCVKPAPATSGPPQVYSSSSASYHYPQQQQHQQQQMSSSYHFRSVPTTASHYSSVNPAASLSAYDHHQMDDVLDQMDFEELVSDIFRDDTEQVTLADLLEKVIDC